MAIPGARGASTVQDIGGMGVQHGDGGVIQSHFDLLAAPRSIALQERQKDAHGAVHAGAGVHDGDADATSVDIGWAIDRHQSRHGLKRRIITRQAAELPGLAKAGYPAMHQARKAAGQIGQIVDPPFFPSA